MLFALVRRASLARPRAFRWMRGENGRMKFGRIYVQSVGVNWSSRELLERRSGIARGIYNRLVENDRFSSGQILSEVHGFLGTMIPAGGFSAYRMVL